VSSLPGNVHIILMVVIFSCFCLRHREQSTILCHSMYKEPKLKLWRIHRVLKTEFYINFKTVEKVSKDHPKSEKAKNFLRFPGKTFFE
jgi:hypothetical protein